jgi:hypothetical protein
MFETIPKLRDERQTFRGRQTNDLIKSEQFHAFQPTKNRSGGQASEILAVMRKEAGRFRFCAMQSAAEQRSA